MGKLNMEKLLAYVISELDKENDFLAQTLRNGLREQGIWVDNETGELITNLKPIFSPGDKVAFGGYRDIRTITKVSTDSQTYDIAEEPDRCIPFIEQNNWIKLMFKEGDKIAEKYAPSTPRIITSIQDNSYCLEDGKKVGIDQQDRYRLYYEDGWYLCLEDLPRFNAGFSYFFYSTNEKKEFMVIVDGISYPWTETNFKKYFKPWTLDDAKPGDLLGTDEDKFWIGIFKGRVETGGIKAYLYTHYDREDIREGMESVFSPTPLHPASPSQRKIFNERMKKSGWIWENGRIFKEIKLEDL
ncbi:MAG: hypothetical protein J6I84_04150 [Bacilli bacterium]|nr:hypothetical protein [Bacilli bacterium]